MLLSSVIIVLREVIEAALLFSILLTLSKRMQIENKWIVWSFFLGIFGAIVYAMNINLVSIWFEGVGQEITNAFIQLFIYFSLLIFIYLLMNFIYSKKQTQMIIYLLILICSLAIIREGAEILLYFFSVTHQDNHFMVVFVGMIIGFSIGISVGFLFYFTLQNISSRSSLFIGVSLLILVAGALISQSTQQLLQADWLEAQLPIWNSSALLSEKSIIGQLLYALIGYEATPTKLQLNLYIMSLILPLLIILIIRYCHLKKLKKTQSQE